MGAGLATALIRTRTAAASAFTPEVSIDDIAPGVPVSPNFVGLSYEKAELVAGGFFSAQNVTLLPLIRSLGPSGTIRIGGNTSDLTRGSPSRTTIAELAAFLRAAGWSLIYGLNLGTGSVEQAVAEALFVVEAVGPLLLAFQIGNEPDLYDRGLRGRRWNTVAFLAEWQRFAGAVRERLPNTPFAGPDVGSQPGWVTPFAALRQPRPTLLTCHYYSEGPVWSPLVDIPGMLASELALAEPIRETEIAAAATGLPMRVTEANSVYGGGKLGVSDTLAAAAWGADLMFQLAAAGWQGINFHHASPGTYSPIIRRGDGRCVARPLYHAMLFFARARAARIVAVRVPDVPGLRAYAMR